jgi:BirA family biotin operon repressor/biotin-[acetyl-CoA-carboxylase] ligase
MTAWSAPELAAAIHRQAPDAATRFETLLLLDEVSSTNDEAWRLHETLPEGGDGAVVLAQGQRGGRGRLGRTWSSPPGNLYLSLLRRIVEPLERASIFSLLTGIALAEALREVAGIEPALKWPNDLLVGDRKLAGILLEGREGFQVVGLGVNVNTRLDELSPEVADIATTLLEETGREHSRIELAGAFLARFADLEREFLREPVLPLDRYLRYFPFVGRPVRVTVRGAVLESTISGVASDGALLLAGPEGDLRITTGEVTHVRPQ